MQALRQPEYVHVLLNHLPVTGLFAVCLVLVAGLVLRRRAVTLLGLGLVSLFAVSAWPVSEFGQQGYDRVYSMADEDGDAWLSHHRELGDRWGWVFYVTAGVGAVGLIVAWKRPRWQWAVGWATVVPAAASLVAGACIAEAGGKVRHREFRHGPAPPVHEQSRGATYLPVPVISALRTQPWPC